MKFVLSVGLEEEEATLVDCVAAASAAVTWPKLLVQFREFSRYVHTMTPVLYFTLLQCGV
ncbi:unnamed protein product [Fusarium graminearum]|nr:unnamed protein product [Fusarium graminearum]